MLAINEIENRNEIENKNDNINEKENNNVYGEYEKSKTILVARHLPTDKNGKDLLLEDPMNKPVPMNAIIKKETGPRRQSNGALIDYSLLGDPDDFEYMEKLYNHENDDQNNNKKIIEEIENESTLIQDNNSNIINKVNTVSNLFNENFEDKKKKKQIHIFQKYCEVKERHALENWKRHSIEWSRMEDFIAKKLHRDKSKNLSRQLTEFGLLNETYRLFEETYDFLGDKNLPFWKNGLTVGSELLGFHITIPRGGPREICQIRRKPASGSDKGNTIPDYLIDKYIDNEKNIFNPEYIEVVGKHTTLEESELAFEFVEHMKKSLSKKSSISSNKKSNTEGSIYSSSKVLSKNSINSNIDSKDEFVIKGLKIEKTMEENNEDEQYVNENNEKCIEEEDIINNGSKSNVSLIFKTDRLVFFSVLNHVVSSILTIYNNGTTAIHFEWKKS